MANKTQMVRARIEPAIKRDAERVLKTLGLAPTQAITLFYRQVALQKGLPFAVKVPNAGTKKALREAKAGIGLREWSGLDELRTAYRR